MQRGDRLNGLDERPEQRQADKQPQKTESRVSEASERSEGREGDDVLDLVVGLARHLWGMRQDRHQEREGGRGPKGRCYAGKEDIRKGIDKIFSSLQDVRWNDPVHFIAGDRGVTEWVMTANTPDGPLEVQGCDVFTVRDGKIAVKNSYLKQRTD